MSAFGLPGGKQPNLATEFALPPGPFAAGTDSTTQLRNPLIMNTPRPAQIGAVDLIPNLLLTTLAVVVVSLPPGQQSTASAPSRTQSYTDTSLATPKTLYIDAIFAPANMTENFPVPERKRDVIDTSQGSPIVLLTTVATPSPFVPVMPPSLPQVRATLVETSRGMSALFLTQPFTPRQFEFASRSSWQPADTSQSSSIALLTPPPPAVPFPPVQFESGKQRVYQPLDTSAGIPKPLFGDAFQPIHNLFLPVPEIRRVLPDTSQGTPLVLTAAPPPPAVPFVPKMFELPQRALTILADTSHGTPKPLYGDAIPPFVNQASFQFVSTGKYALGPDTSRRGFQIPQPAPTVTFIMIINE